MTRHPASALCRSSLLGATFVVGIGLAHPLHGEISGQNVISGNAVFIQTANGWIIKPSNNAIIEYSMFGVKSNELIKFIQADASSRVLNRVVGDFPTNIDGRLQANGIVYIVNPAGVFIGPHGLVDVGGIYAAAGNIGDGDFLNGTDSFTGMKGRVENAGDVNAKSVAAFMGTNVVNSGTIDTGPDGLTALVASTGSVRLLPTSQDGKVFVDVAISSDPLAPPNSPIGVLNSGGVRSGVGGQVLLGAGDLYSLAIKNTSTSVTRTPGGIVLMKGGRISQEGQIAGARLGIDCEGIDLASNVRFDRSRINGDITLQSDVLVRGENGAAAQWFTVRGAIRSAAGMFYSFVSNAAQTIIHNDVGTSGAGRLGSMTLHGDAGFGDDVFTRGDLTIDGRTSIYDGNRDQLIQSSEGRVRLGDDFIKLGENLVIEGQSVELGGDGLSVRDLTIRCAEGQSITFTGSGDQRLVSHTGITFEGDVVKPAGGMLHIGAPIIRATGDIVNDAGDLILAGVTEFNGVGDQRAGSGGGTLRLLGPTSKTTAGQLDLFGVAIDVHFGVTTSDGDLRFDGDTNFLGTGDQAATAGGGELRFFSDVTKSTAGSLTLTGDTLAFGGDASTTEGDLLLNGDATFDGKGAQEVRAEGGELVLSGSAVKTSGGDLRLGSSEALRLGGDAEAQGGDLLLDAPDITLDGEGDQALRASERVVWNSAITKAQADLLIEAGFRIDLGGDVAVENGSLVFRGPVLLSLDATTSAENVLFDGTLDGPFALVVNADRRIEFTGDIGQADVGKGGAPGLRSLALNAGEFVEFSNDGGTRVRVAEGISFNAGDSDAGAIPDIATIGSAGDLIVECGDFLMGARQKLTVIGSLSIDATSGGGTGTVTLGDVNVLNVLAVTADGIRLRSRDGGSVRTLTGSVTDVGAEIIAGGAISFSTIPILLGDGSIQFASFDANADTTGNLSGFTLRLLGEPISADALRAGGVYFDLSLQPLPAPPNATSTASPATILAVEETGEGEDALDADRTILRENERLALNRLFGPGLRVRGQLPVELERGGSGTTAFDSGEATQGRTDVATPRLSRDAAVRFLGAHARLSLLTATPEAKARATAIANQLTSANAAERSAIARGYEAGADRDDASLAAAISDTLRWGEAIGLSDAERSSAGTGGVAFPESAVRAAIGG